MKIDFSKSEIIWLYDYIGHGNSLDIGVQIYRKLKPLVAKLNRANELHKQADLHQASMSELRKEAAALEDEIK